MYIRNDALRNILNRVAPTNRICARCGGVITHSDIKDYPFLCIGCDENMFTFETIKKGVKL